MGAIRRELCFLPVSKSSCSRPRPRSLRSLLCSGWHVLSLSNSQRALPLSSVLVCVLACLRLPHKKCVPAITLSSPALSSPPISSRSFCQPLPNSPMFLHRDGFIWEQQRIAIQDLWSNGDPRKSRNTGEKQSFMDSGGAVVKEAPIGGTREF